uniref:RBR-type E3 ubiquitin transferase n=1 Tax=Neobodo designis TaxID=312471 RepID=A0A7S1Q8V7_NEODS|mmetsp:Transcript_37478/g.115742  ORF Transcript_37478/g.115742 Transcript_37478/m.115742 type:complete len:491 (+) Transcript_37478:151-1623(+)|eukprot:CAMPEP_0174828948 /NCGR_PEP_ID=MMETSP1114-20130205/1623_1 /TAXON_ID=312471 /ORGANISM="Neobodo designis, Strain CCAP 1951/1" /LENGTH=490 /DNA_ID=CAMNT_0016062681 /DNA_START=151 /DNA_END=1623 /DNA_ORIENTATION=-
MSDADEYVFDDGDCAYDDGDDGGMMGDYAVGSDALFTQPETKEKPKLLTHAQVLDLVDERVADVVAVMAWSPTSALLMLHHCKWSTDRVKERYFEDPDALIKASGVKDMDDKFVVSDCECDCGMCWDSVPAGSSAALACCHAFCMDCWGSHLQYALKNQGSNVIAVRCPQKECPQFCGRQAYAAVFGKKSAEFARYAEFVVKAFVENSDRHRECPAPNCNLVAQYMRPMAAVEGPSAPVHCDCGFDFCFACGFEDHAPASCAEMTAWRKKEVDESETANWVAANTKPCPGKSCGKTVEKNGGCNHMTCPACKHEWCWVCEGPWSTHGSSYYKCNQFDKKGGESERERNRDAARSELERYIHYYSRYQNHGRSRKLDKVVLQRTQNRISRELAASTAASIIDLDYLNKTATVLTKCRHALQYTYVYAFYMKDQRQKDLFEFNQAQLEYWTELLSEYIEDTTGAHSKQEVVNRTSTAEKMLEKMQEGCVKLS